MNSFKQTLEDIWDIISSIFPNLQSKRALKNQTLADQRLHDLTDVLKKNGLVIVPVGMDEMVIHMDDKRIFVRKIPWAREDVTVINRTTYE